MSRSSHIHVATHTQIPYTYTGECSGSETESVWGTCMDLNTDVNPEFVCQTLFVILPVPPPNLRLPELGLFTYLSGNVLHFNTDLNPEFVRQPSFVILHVEPYVVHDLGFRV